MKPGAVTYGTAWALVTGAGSGIGRCFALRLAALGYRMVLAGDRPEPLAAMREQLLEAGCAEVQVVVLDLAREGAAQELFDATAARGIGVDVLVNNAGMFSFCDILRTPAERIGRMIMLHAMTTTHLCRLYAADMIRRGGGSRAESGNESGEERSAGNEMERGENGRSARSVEERGGENGAEHGSGKQRGGEETRGNESRRAVRGYILNMSSYSQWMPFPGMALYSASKAYLRQFSVCFAKEVRAEGIRVTAICPAGVATDLYGLTPRWQRIGRRLGVLITADSCARRGLKALWRGRRCIVPDWWNRAWIPLCKLAPMCVLRPLRKYTLKFQK